jgi:ankyrin repeat protein
LEELVQKEATQSGIAQYVKGSIEKNSLGPSVLNRLRGMRGETLLYQAARHKNLALFKLLLEKGADPFITTEWEKNTALHELIAQCHNEGEAVLKILEGVATTLNHNDSANAQTILACLIEGCAYLHTSEESLNNVLVPLEQVGVNWKHVDFQGRTLLHRLVARRPDGRLSKLDVKSYYSIISSEHQPYGRQCRENSLVMLVKLLIDRGVDALGRDDYGFTAGDIAENMGHPSALITLLTKNTPTQRSQYQQVINALAKTLSVIKKEHGTHSTDEHLSNKEPFVFRIQDHLSKKNPFSSTAKAVAPLSWIRYAVLEEYTYSTLDIVRYLYIPESWIDEHVEKKSSELAISDTQLLLY